MDRAASAKSGKGAGDENFPVASWLIAKQHRPAIMAFYNFVRTADDVSDHASLPASEKLHLLDQLETCLLGQNDDEPTAVALRAILTKRNLIWYGSIGSALVGLIIALSMLTVKS